MFKKILVLFLCGLMMFLMCGCDLFASDAAELLSPPSLAGDLSPIADAIDKSAGGEYNFQYPSRGNYRSAVVQSDIDSDGILEAFAFYSMSDGETITMTVNAVFNDNGKWVSLAQQKIVAGGVDRVDFCDLDGDGKSEILVGWEIYGTSEMQLAVYSISENALIQRMLQKYTHFITCDLDEDDKNEILIIKTGSIEQNNSAALYKISDEGVTEISSCDLDSAAKTINEPIVAELSTGKTAVYIDEIKGVGAITEILFMEKGKLMNPLFQPETRETLATLRSAAFSVSDINNDGILEIPVQENVPSVTRSDVNEKLYLTNWCSFNGEILTIQLTAMINTEDGYYYSVPSKWAGKIAILKDTDGHLREIYRYNAEEMTVGESLIYIKTVNKSKWDHGDYKADGVYEIMNDGDNTYICSITAAAVAEGITLEQIKANFRLFE